MPHGSAGDSTGSSTDATSALWGALGTVLDPEVLRPITELGMVARASVADGVAQVELLLTVPTCPQRSRLEAQVREATLGVPGVASVEIVTGVMNTEQRQRFTETVRGGKPARRNPFGEGTLTRVILVSSGKGGVGKSSVTVGLACALAARGRRVGLIDADVFGFSIPHLMGLSQDGVTPAPSRVDDLILPPVAHGVKVISIGMFLGDKDTRTQAVHWRGPMLHRTIEQFLKDVWFGDLDYLLLDMPPGTGDIAISVHQLLPTAEVVVVTTPQVAAADVAVRSALLGAQNGHRVLGVIETMSANPQEPALDLFGAGGGELVAERLTTLTGNTVPVLGSLPLSREFRIAGDAGIPAPVHCPDDPATQALVQVAATIDSTGRSLTGKPLPMSF